MPHFTSGLYEPMLCPPCGLICMGFLQFDGAARDLQLPCLCLPRRTGRESRAGTFSNSWATPHCLPLHRSALPAPSPAKVKGGKLSAHAAWTTWNQKVVVAVVESGKPTCHIHVWCHQAVPPTARDPQRHVPNSVAVQQRSNPSKTRVDAVAAAANWTQTRLVRTLYVHD